MARPLIIAHRGASAEKPENTLAAFRRAVALGVDGIELDVQTTRDGVAVVFHDDRLKRLTGEKGLLSAWVWRDLSRLQVFGAEAIPRLVDVLRFTRGKVVVQVELKKGVRLPPVLAAIKAARATDWVILASFEVDLVQEARLLAPTVPRMVISEGRRPRAWVAQQLARTGALGLSVRAQAIRSPAWLAWFQQRGYSVWSWTINDSAMASRLAEWGIDALLGDDPTLLQRAV